MKKQSNLNIDLYQKIYLDFVKERDVLLAQDVTYDEKVALFVKTWKILNGSEINFDEQLYQRLVTQSLQRSKNPQGFQNQILAMKASAERLKVVFRDVQVPALIIHGTQSPIFSKEHAIDLSNKIPHARLEFVQGMGHILNPCFYEILEELITTHISRSVLVENKNKD